MSAPCLGFSIARRCATARKVALYRARDAVNTAERGARSLVRTILRRPEDFTNFVEVRIWSAAMASVIGDLTQRRENDFSKIQARFSNRIPLNSADVAEVIQKRLLAKTDRGAVTLGNLHDREENNLKTLFDFADGSIKLKNYRDRDHFISSYPFPPYQYTLFQMAITGLSQHNAFEGRHSSVGERSMLGVFQQVAKELKEQPVGGLATFDLMFEGIRSALKSSVQQSIQIAERNLDDPFAVRVLKVLFLLKYVKEFKPSVRNISVLLLSEFDTDQVKQKRRIEEALGVLERNTLIQRNGDVYEFLTNEEKDVEAEIKGLDVDPSEVSKEFETLAFDTVLRHRKIKHLATGSDYPFTRKLDDHALGREYELSIKGTGKSHIYSEFSPHGQLISGGEVTVPKLFVNNSNGRIGLVGYWDVVAFDEFAGREKKANKALVDIMKNYMANKTFSRGVSPMGAEASFAFVGNTDHNVPFMLKNSDLFEALPAQFHDSAFIDRLHAYLPGWEVDVIRGEMFTSNFGFIVDYLAEILRNLRQEDFSNRARAHFEFGKGISERDETAVSKTVSGLLKLIFPNGGETPDEVEELLHLAMECRKRVKDQLFRIDPTYPPVEFYFRGPDGQKTHVRTVEEDEFPHFYKLKPAQDPKEQTQSDESGDPVAVEPEDEEIIETTGVIAMEPGPKPEEGHQVYSENRKGVSYDKLFGPYIDGADRIVVTDPYIRIFYQIRNMMEFVEMVIRRKAPEDQVAVHLVTGPDDGNLIRQRELLDSITEACTGTGVEFTWAFDNSGSAHARDIVTDTGWKIVLDRGLDIFQPPVKRDGFNLGDRLQEHRMVKNFYVTYVPKTTDEGAA